MSHSHKNKSVITIRSAHFMNSVFVNPGIYSCGVKAFLEISAHLFLPYLSNLRIMNDFTDQAPVVQTVDNAIHRINHYPLDIAIDFAITYPVDSDLSGG